MLSVVALNKPEPPSKVVSISTSSLFHNLALSLLALIYRKLSWEVVQSVLSCLCYL